MIGLIISLIIIGLIAGALARLLVPGKQDMSVPMTVLIGIIGSFVGGFLGYLIFHHDSQNGFFQPSGIIGSVIGAVIVLLIWIRQVAAAASVADHREDGESHTISSGQGGERDSAGGGGVGLRGPPVVPCAGRGRVRRAGNDPPRR